jgi:2-polyprenyl-3-methyl-5-hydroxy-6-metoxy-1,4-benzoquinol methylase
MTKTSEVNDEKLKTLSKNWWSSHSQDYVDPGETPHLGLDADLSDDQLLEIFDKIDKNFMKDGYFAQDLGKPLFSRLMPNSLAGKNVLEIGCGLGSHTETLCRLGATVTSIDLAPMSIKITKRRLKLKGLKAKVIEADAENLPFSDESFDYVWSWGVIHHSPNTIRCARELDRVLKPGGSMAVMVYHRNSLYNWINVILRYGILKGKLLTMTIQDLHNRYTDGKEVAGAPLSKYYTAREVREVLFPAIDITSQRTFEQKHAVSFWVPSKYRRKFEDFINDTFYTFIWSKFGFLIFSEGTKRLMKKSSAR